MAAGNRELPPDLFRSVQISHSHAGLQLRIWRDYHGVEVVNVHSFPFILKDMFERLCEVQWRDMLREMEERWPTK